MNIARELGSLLSGLLAPQEPTATRQTGKNTQDRSRAASRDDQRLQSPAGSGKDKDRITLSSASRDLLASTLGQESRINEEAASHPLQSGRILALPQPTALAYSPASAEPRGGAPHSETVGTSSTGVAPESPATRQLVRATYGTPGAVNNSAVATVADRIDIHA